MIELDKLKRIRDLCSHESWNFGYVDDYDDQKLYRQGRAEFAQSILELIGITDMFNDIVKSLIIYFPP